MVDRHKLIDFLNKVLCPENFKDYCPNGLQVEGKENLRKISFSVSATIESIQKSCKWGSDALITHHGILWNYQSGKTITGPHYKRIKGLIDSNINLISYHLPLDAHLDYGNAAGLAKSLGLKNIEGFGSYKGSFVGVKGDFETGVDSLELKKNLKSILNHPIIHAKPGTNQVKNIGIITGGANNDWNQCLSHDLDAYLTGEISEYNWHDAIEHNVHFYACGHHATERFGVMSLMDLIETEFDVETIFFDSENPV